jgi:hypothetical protein
MKYIFLIGLTLALLTSCSDMEEEITWNTKNIPAKAVVEGYLTTDTCYQKIRLTQTADYFLNEPTPRISGAQVSVTDGSKTYLFEEADTAPGDYYSTVQFAGIPGAAYTLNVELANPIDGTASLSASDKMIQGFNIDSMKVYIYKNPYAAYNTGDEEVDSTITVFYMNGSQPKDIVNYYTVQIYKSGVPIYKDISEIELMSDEYSEDPEETELFYFYMGNFTVNDTMTIELTSITKEYYEYIRTIQELSTPPDVLGFSGPPADAVGNVNGGSQLGFFSTGQKTRFTAVARRPENIKEAIY